MKRAKASASEVLGCIKLIFLSFLKLMSPFVNLLCLGVLAITILRLTTALDWFMFILSSAFLLLSILLIHLSAYTKLLGYLWELSLAMVGWLVGFYLDFGIINIHVLYELCAQGNMLLIAPMTVIGMFVGCNLGMLISKKLALNASYRSSYSDSNNVLSFVSSNAGMLIGMLLFEHISSLTSLLTDSISMLLHLTLMILIGHITHSLICVRNKYHPKILR